MNKVLVLLIGTAIAQSAQAGIVHKTKETLKKPVHGVKRLFKPTRNVAVAQDEPIVRSKAR